jgi:hypothetical protein
VHIGIVHIGIVHIGIVHIGIEDTTSSVTSKGTGTLQCIGCMRRMFVLVHITPLISSSKIVTDAARPQNNVHPCCL